MPLPKSPFFHVAPQGSLPAHWQRGAHTHSAYRSLRSRRFTENGASFFRFFCENTAQGPLRALCGVFYIAGTKRAIFQIPSV